MFSKGLKSLLSVFLFMELNSGVADDVLSLDDKKELAEITHLIKQKTSPKDKGSKSKLKDMTSSPIVNDKVIKLRLVKFFLKIIGKTPKVDQSIQDTAYLLTGFIFYEFDSDLDRILDDASTLELPASQIDGDQIKLFEKLKSDLENYVKKIEK